MEAITIEFALWAGYWIVIAFDNNQNRLRGGNRRQWHGTTQWEALTWAIKDLQP